MGVQVGVGVRMTTMLKSRSFGYDQPVRVEQAMPSATPSSISSWFGSPKPALALDRSVRCASPCDWKKTQSTRFCVVFQYVVRSRYGATSLLLTLSLLF